MKNAGSGQEKDRTSKQDGVVKIEDDGKGQRRDQAVDYLSRRGLRGSTPPQTEKVLVKKGQHPHHQMTLLLITTMLWFWHSRKEWLPPGAGQ